MKSIVRSVATGLLVLSGGFQVLAQDANRFGEYDVVGTSYHKFVLPGESSISVLVLSSAGGSGIYEVGRTTDMGQLLALSGISFAPARATEVYKVTLRLLRQNSGARSEIYRSPLEEFLSLPGAYPDLADGDILVVETKVKSKFGWRDLLGVVTGVAATTLAIDRLSRAF